jgi:site-specific DNA recombinase
MQVALYARVSTARQAENDLSIPDQLRQMRQWAERNGHAVVKEYVEPGNTGTDDKRPMFQTMVSDAALKPSPFQIIVVHSFSRFFRDLVEGAMYQRKLLKLGVRLESITQHTSDDSAGQMQRHMIMLFDEYQSKEIAKHVLRGMQENARQGYFNGSIAPYGYKTYDAGQTGFRGRFKKKLAIEDFEAKIVKEIYALYVHGKNSPRIGAKEIAKRFNANGTPLRGKRKWGSQMILDVLSCPIYTGNHRFNRRNAKTKQVKDKAEWVTIPVPAIIDQELFDKAALLRAANSPKRCAPRRETSPTLLTGLVRCGHCGTGMVMATGKSGQYRYYKCGSRIRRGNAACPSGNIPMEKLDNLVLDAFRQKVYTPEHIREVVDTLRKHASKTGGHDEKQLLKKLEADLLVAEQAQTRLYEAVEKGLMELDDQLKLRMQQNKTKRESLLAEIADLKRQRQSPLQTITPQKVEAVARILNRKLSESTPFAKAYLKATLNEITIMDQTVCLSGGNATMAGLIAANGQIQDTSSVPRFMPEWWT